MQLIVKTNEIIEWPSLHYGVVQLTLPIQGSSSYFQGFTLSVYNAWGRSNRRLFDHYRHISETVQDTAEDIINQ